MNQGIREKAAELGRLLAASEEARRLREAREEVERHEAARIMWRDLQSVQEKVRERQARGQEVPEEERRHLARTLELAAYNPYLRALLEAELALTERLVEVQAIVAREALGEGGGPQASENPAGEDPPAQRSSGRLWVPGSGPVGGLSGGIRRPG